VTSDILSGKDESFAKNILFKYFSESKELGKELQLYNFLVNEVAKDETQAEKYIEIVLKQRDKLNQKSLTSEKYNLIKEIKDVYPINDLFKSSIKNYKVLASIYKIFENHGDKNSKFDVKEIVTSRTCIVENLCGIKKVNKETEDEMINVYKQQNEEVRLLSYKILVESLNEKYKDLDSNQKNLLKEYINSISNTNSLKTLIDSEVTNVKKQLAELTNKISDDVIKIKINETVKQLDNVKKFNLVKDNQVMVLLLSYELIKEIKNQI
jgi:hypothetical protein